MADTYEIEYQGKPVGRVRTERQGLYHCFHCRCLLPDDGMYRIHVLGGDKREDLGICIPVEGKFGMDKKIPRKRLGEGELTFRLVPKDWKPQEIPMAEKPEPMLHEGVVKEKESVPCGEETVEEETVLEPVIPETAEEAAEEREKEAAEKPAEEMLPLTVPAEIFVPVSEEEPFEHLDKLEDARMEICNDVPGIVMPEIEEE